MAFYKRMHKDTLCNVPDNHLPASLIILPCALHHILAKQLAHYALFCYISTILRIVSGIAHCM